MHKAKMMLSGFTAFVMCTSMLGGLGMTTAEAAETAPAQAAIISVDAGKVLRDINPDIYGTNHRYYGNGVNMWDTANNRAFPEFEKQYDDIGLKSIRYPGGTSGNLLQWKRAIGTIEQRTKVRTINRDAPEVATYGIDEAARFAEKNNLTLVMNYGAGSGNAQDAADLVEYFNSPNDGKHPWAAERAKNGHPEPYNVKHFEIGNEFFLLPGMEYWMGGESDKSPEQLYVHGGTVKFTDQGVGLIDDFRTAAANSDGKPNQKKYVKYAPVDAGTGVVKANDVIWTKVNTLQGAGAQNVYTIDEPNGVIQFGDGVNGNIPASGSRITITYKTTHDGFDKYYKLMKQVDPSIKIYSNMYEDEAISEFGKTIPYDGMVIHPYTAFFLNGSQGPAVPYNDPDKFYETFMLDAESKINDIQTLTNKMVAATGNPNLYAIPTEHGMLDNNGPEFYQLSLGNALYSASMQMSIIDMGIPLAQRHSLIDYRKAERNMGTIGNNLALLSSDTYLQSASAKMFKMFTHMTGDKQVDAKIANNPVKTTYNGKSLNKLKTVASKKGNDLYLMVLNQDESDQVTAKVQLANHAAKSAEVWTLNSVTHATYNTDSNPNAVDIQKKTMAVTSSNVNYTFPAHSLTAFKFTLDGGPAAKISLDASKVLRDINSDIFGTNHRYYSNGVNMWDAVNNRVFPEFDKQYGDVGLKSIRYPGGTSADTLHWKRAIGPLEDRQKVRTINRNAPETATFGYDEAARFAEKQGATLVIDYGIGVGNAQDAADLVEYYNSPNDGKHPWAAKRAQNGHLEPYNVKHFEIGNQTWYPGERYWMEGQPESEYRNLYINGGTVAITDQQVGLIDDWREPASKSDGKPNQVKYVKYAPVNPATGVIKVGGTTWTKVNSLQGAGSQNVYVLDERIGIIQFGDGVNGNIPAAGSIITISYQSTHDGFKDYYKQMKLVDPSIKIYSSLYDAQAIQEFGNKVPYDGMVIHPYSYVNFGEGTAVIPTGNMDHYYEGIMQEAEAKVKEVSALQEAMVKGSGNSKVYPFPSEHGLIDPTGPNGTKNYQLSMGSALYTASMQMGFIDMGLPIAQRHSLVDFFVDGPKGSNIAGNLALFSSQTYLQSASAKMFKLFTHMTGDKQIDAKIDNNPSRTSYNGKPLNKLKVVASKKGSDVYLTVLNQDESDDVSASVQLSGYKPASTAEVWSLNSVSHATYNTDANPKAVDIQVSTLNADSNGLTYTFPAHSLTAFKFTAQKEEASHRPSRGGGGGSAAASTSQSSATIPAGASGSVNLGEEFKLTVPAGASTEVLNITLQKIMNSDNLKPKQMSFVSPVFELLKNVSGNFLKPVTLSLKYDVTQAGNKKVAIFYYKEEDKQWIEVGGTVSGDTVTVSVDHFTKFAVLAVDHELPNPKNEVPKNNWTDIQGHWSESKLKEAFDKGIIDGYADRTFRPDGTITRAEFTVMLARALKLQGNGAKLTFSDAGQIPDWALEGVSRTVNIGLVSGYEDNTFRADRPVTRAEIVVMVARALKVSDKGLSATGFADDASIPVWAKGAIAAASQQGIVSGQANNMFAPNHNATRAEVTVTLLRMLQHVQP
ncbi:S-layer homology domain-containing protein [Paenibacillus radicis (ex Xue et al. 2023)]|uniref:non-reducing end alpha-L-arabinofuranosidase n=1 Tax=Paenibacillus radicis (ex Xue et al. 2023) TaxID=2972489 RepID=A0ABT1YHJ9_9BACL|nr:S-layer homology domain-containing protein [Paenibacillus radicis (ex Xue et al. 2023)]MCR8632671.1 S-layer homology domain-containing protein [Paenibacillus radicis (ex Xue et al. 2023)]